MPNRRRRQLSTAMSAVAALAVASPFAVVAVTELSASTKPAPQHREFVQASLITDLPGELLSALTQGLSQFGINVPPMPNLLTGSGSLAPVTLTPGLGTTQLTAPPGVATTPLTAPPGVATTAPSTALTAPSAALPGATASPPLTGTDLTNPALANPALTNPVAPDPSLISPTGQTPGLTTPPTGITDPALTAPISTGMPATEVPISEPIGLDTYPIIGGDPSLATMPASTDAGLIGEISSAAEKLGAGQAIDLLKGMVMQPIMGAIKLPAPPAVPVPAAPVLAPAPTP